MGAGFNFNQAEAIPQSTESPDQLNKHVESGVGPAWLKLKPGPTLTLCAHPWSKATSTRVL